MADKIFYFLSFTALLCALMVVFARNPVYSVLYLILTFFCLSGHYILLNAQFLAVVNTIVYAGAIMVLFLFVIMFLNLRHEGEDKRTTLGLFAGVISGGLLMLILIAAFKDAGLMEIDQTTFNSQAGLIKPLGKVLFEKFLLPFELVSVLFLVAIVGAVMLGKREEGETRHL